LIELLIAVTILGLISLAITETFTVLARSTDATSTRLIQSRGPKLVGVYWTPDVNTSEQVNPTGVLCGTSGTPLVTFAWTAPDQASDVFEVSTWSTVTTGASTSLVRTQCTSDALGAPVMTTTVAPDIDAANTQAQCGDSVSLGPCGSDSTPARVVLTLVTADGRSYANVGVRKVS